MLNRPENREAFVAEFGPAQHPDGPYCVDDATAWKILDAFDRDPDRYWRYGNLWGFIMQDRASYMLGEIHLIDHRKRGRKISDAKYNLVGQRVTDSIYTFIRKLEKGS